MSYKTLSEQAVLRIADSAVIPFDTGNLDYQAYLAWVAEGNTSAPADPPPPPPADWRSFLEALKASTVFAALRGQARVSVEANALATELRLALGEAALGAPDAATIQALLGELLPTLSAEQVAEVGAAVAAFNIPLSLG